MSIEGAGAKPDTPARAGQFGFKPKDTVCANHNRMTRDKYSMVVVEFHPWKRA